MHFVLEELFKPTGFMAEGFTIGVCFSSYLLAKVGGWVLAECFGEVGDVFFEGAQGLVIPFATCFWARGGVLFCGI